MKSWKCEIEVDANSHFPLAVSTITQFHNIQDRSALGWQLKCQRAAKDFRVGPRFARAEGVGLPDERSEELCEAKSQEAEGRFVSLRLAEGRRPEGRGGAWRRSFLHSNPDC